MEFGQLIRYNMRNIFLENSSQYLVEKLVPDPFLKTLEILSISLDQHSEILYSLFLLYNQVDNCQNKLKLRC